MKKASLLSLRQEAEHHTNSLMSKHAKRLADSLLSGHAINYRTQIFQAITSDHCFQLAKESKSGFG